METPKDMLKRHEGLRLKMYKDTEGYHTIGYGHNMDANPISKTVADLIFEEDYAKAEADARTLVKNFDQLSPARQGVLINMTFQMGLDGMRKWKNTLAFIEAGDFTRAAENMRKSLWYRQVPVRANELIKIMEVG